MLHGPKVRTLIERTMARMMAPPSSDISGLVHSIYVSNSKLSEHKKNATLWVEQALRDVKASSQNVFGGDDEAIAGEILGRLGVMARRSCGME